MWVSRVGDFSPLLLSDPFREQRTVYRNPVTFRAAMRFSGVIFQCVMITLTVFILLTLGDRFYLPGEAGMDIWVAWGLNGIFASGFLGAIVYTGYYGLPCDCPLPAPLLTVMQGDLCYGVAADPD